MALEDLTLYVAQRTDKEKRVIMDQLRAPMDSVHAKLSDMEQQLTSFQHTTHLLIAEMNSDKHKSATIQVWASGIHEVGYYASAQQLVCTDSTSLYVAQQSRVRCAAVSLTLVPHYNLRCLNLA